MQRTILSRRSFRGSQLSTSGLSLTSSLSFNRGSFSSYSYLSAGRGPQRNTVNSTTLWNTSYSTVTPLSNNGLGSALSMQHNEPLTIRLFSTQPNNVSKKTPTQISPSPSVPIISSISSSSSSVTVNIPLPDEDGGIMIDDDDESMRHGKLPLINNSLLLSILLPSSSVVSVSPQTPSLHNNMSLDEILLMHQAYIDKYKNETSTKSSNTVFSMDQQGDIYDGLLNILYQTIRRLSHQQYFTLVRNSSSNNHNSLSIPDTAASNSSKPNHSSVRNRDRKTNTNNLRTKQSLSKPPNKNDMAYPIHSPSIPVRYEAYLQIPTVLQDKQIHKQGSTADEIHSRWITMVQSIITHAETVLRSVTHELRSSSSSSTPTTITLSQTQLLTKWNNIVLRLYPFLHTNITPSSESSIDYSAYITRIDTYILQQTTLLNEHHNCSSPVVSLGLIRWILEYTGTWHQYQRFRGNSRLLFTVPLPTANIHPSLNPVVQFCIHQLPLVLNSFVNTPPDTLITTLPTIMKHTDAIITALLHLQYKFSSSFSADPKAYSDKRILPPSISKSVLQILIKEMENIARYGFVITTPFTDTTATAVPTNESSRPRGSPSSLSSKSSFSNGLPLSRFILCLRTMTRLQGLGWYSFTSYKPNPTDTDPWYQDNQYRQKIIDLFTQCNSVSDDNTVPSGTSDNSDTTLTLPELHMDARLLARFVTTVEPSNFSSRLNPSAFSDRVAILCRDANITSWNPEAVARLAAYTSRLGTSAPLILLRTLRNMTMKFLREGSKAQSGRIFSPVGITAVVHMMRSCKAQDTTFLNSIFDYVASILRKETYRRNFPSKASSSSSSPVIESDFTPSQVARLCHVMTSSGIQHTPFLDAVVSTFPPQSFIHTSYRGGKISSDSSSDPYNSLTSLLWALVCGGHVSMYHAYIQQIIALLPNKLPILETITDSAMNKITDIVFPLHLSSLVIDAHNQEVGLTTVVPSDKPSSIVPVRNLPLPLREQVRICMNKIENNSSSILHHHNLTMNAFESALTGTLKPSLANSLPFRGRLMAELIASSVRISKEYNLPLPQYFVHHPLTQFTIDIMFTTTTSPDNSTVQSPPVKFVQRTHTNVPAVGIQLFHSSWFLPQELDSRLNVATPSLLGVSTVFHPSAVSRMYALRQLDPHLEMIIATHRLPNELGTIMNRNLFGSRNAYKLLDNWIMNQLIQTNTFASTLGHSKAGTVRSSA